MAGVRGRSGGHNRKPRHMHLVNATFRPDRHGNREQAKTEVRENKTAQVLSPPSYLAPNAKALFRRVARGLRKRGDIAPLDVEVLACYCQAAGELSDAERAIKFELREARRVLATQEPEAAELLEAHREAVAIARRIIGHSARMVPGKDRGSWVRNPAVITGANAASRIRYFAGEFGLSPVSLARLRSSGELGPRGGESADEGHYCPPELDDLHEAT